MLVFKIREEDRLNIITKIVLAVLVVLIIASGVIYLSQEDESTPELAKNGVDSNTNEKDSWVPVFAAIGLLAVIWLVLRQREQ